MSQWLDRLRENGFNLVARSTQVNDNEWPSLAKSPVTTSDAEHPPPPVMGPLPSVPSGNKKSIKPAVPAVAVPRAFETRIQQP